MRASAPAGRAPARQRQQQQHAPSRRRCIRVAAAKKGSSAVGFRYNGAQLRWERDDRFAGLAADPSQTLIQPKTGSAYRAWPVVHTVLSEAGLKSVSVAEAAKLQRQGWTLVDVRLGADFAKQSAAGSVSAPMFREVQGTSFWDNAKKLAMAGFAMRATERDPDFVEVFTRAVGKKNARVLVMCAIGGTLDVNVSYRREKKIFADPERQFGRESRSLKAIYELLEEGGWNISNIRHVEGGMQQWRYTGLPLADEDDDDA